MGVIRPGEPISGRSFAVSKSSVSGQDLSQNAGFGTTGRAEVRDDYMTKWFAGVGCGLELR
jgi:hypothetical protein